MEGFIKSNEFCKVMDIGYMTFHRWFKSGKIIGAAKTKTGQILIPKSEPNRLLGLDGEQNDKQ